MAEQNSPAGGGNVYAAPEARVDDVIPEGESELAGRGVRFLAALIDGLLLGFLNFGVAMLFGYNMFSPSAPPTFATTLLLMLSGVALYMLLNGYLLQKNGQTIGKKLLSIKIVRNDGSQATLGRIVLFRLLPVWVVSAIPILGAVLSLVDALFIFRENHKCIHDNIADTMVIKV
ncbi:MAG: RDD family protein [Betaproteobacteria bacterium]